jgi:retron-type reverse transcriptase
MSAFLTAFYSTRLVYLTFLSKPNGYKSVICVAYDSSDKICFTLGCLAVPTIFIGFLAKDMVVGLGTPFWGNAIYVRPENMNMFDAEFILQFYKLLPLIFSFSGICLAFVLYQFQSKLLFQIKTIFFFKKIYNFLNKKWFFDKVYNEWVGQFFFKFGYSVSYKVRVNSVRRGLWKGIGKEAVGFLKASMYLRLLDSNFGNSLIQGPSDPLLLLLILLLWGVGKHGLSTLSVVCNVDRSILFKKLDWQELLPFGRESRKKFHIIWRFGDEFDKRVCGVLDVNFVSTRYNFSGNKSYNYVNQVLKFNRFFSIVSIQLKNRYNKKTRKFENIFPFISSVENLQEAWYETKNKPSDLTFGGDSVNTLYSLEPDWFIKTSDKLNSGFYKYRPVKHVFIDKPHKYRKRSVIISSFRDKIVQKAILRILQQIYEGVSAWEAVNYETFKNFKDSTRFLYGVDFKRVRLEKGVKIYEVRKWILVPIFSQNSFGYNSNCSMHLAFQLIKRTWAPVIWFWSADLCKIFDKINQNKLIIEIEKKIDDPKLIYELYKMFKVKIINFNILFPFLFNIYLLSLDKYIDNLKVKYHKQGTFIPNSKFCKGTLSDQKKFKRLGFQEQKKMIKFEQDKASAEALSPISVCSQTIKVHYVRYIDNMLLGAILHLISVNRFFFF